MRRCLGTLLLLLSGSASAFEPAPTIERLLADTVARSLMARGPALDWSDWQVEVYDRRGRRVMTRAFADAQAISGGIGDGHEDDVRGADLRAEAKAAGSR